MKSVQILVPAKHEEPGCFVLEILLVQRMHLCVHKAVTASWVKVILLLLQYVVKTVCRSPFDRGFPDSEFESYSHDY